MINNNIIPYSEKIKNLGLTIDKRLTLTNHITSLSQSVNHTLHNLRQIRPFIDQSTTQLLATSLILPRLDYCNSTFYSLSYKDKLILHKLQNNAIRLIYNLPKYSRQHITPLRKKLHWLPNNQRTIYKICLTTHLALHHKTPDYILDLIHPNSTMYEQRSINKFKLKTPSISNKLSTQLKAFSLHAPSIWNQLPSSLRSCISTTTFKSKLKTYLFSI